jgi:hypothetical protein
MRSTKTILGGALMIALMASPGLLSARPPVDRMTAADASSSPLLLAMRLVMLGEARSDPWALLMGARILNRLALDLSDARVESPPSPRLPLQSRPILELARSLAKSDTRSAALMPLIEDELASVPRGTDAGDRIAHTVIGSGRTLRLHLQYVGGKRASFRLESDDTTRVRMSVRGPAGPVCQPRHEIGSIQCSWQPKSDVAVVVEAAAIDDVEQAVAYRHN